MFVAVVLAGLEAVEAAAGGERRALGYFGEVLVEEHPGDEPWREATPTFS